MSLLCGADILGELERRRVSHELVVYRKMRVGRHACAEYLPR